MNNPTVCILTAGKGTRMGPYAVHINKALLPIQHKAIISHIIEHFPKETEFVIALGHLADQVKDYLQLAHPDRQFTLVTVDNFDGKGSGPGYSLLCCEKFLQRPFVFVSCDTLWQNQLDYQCEKDWLGVARVNPEESKSFCNFEIADGCVVGVKDKTHAPWPPYKAFVGLCFIKSYETFWKGLRKTTMIAGEHQVSNGVRALIDQCSPLAVDIDWTDVGSLDHYQKAVSRFENFDFSKSNEFLYIVNNRVIKYFSDRSIAEKRVEKAKMKCDVFPRIDEHRGSFYRYAFHKGKTLYEHNDLGLFCKLLPWLKEYLWTPVDIAPEQMTRICKKFYYDKTLERLSLYYEKYRVDDKASVINGEKVPSTKELLEEIPWEDLYRGIPTFFHGDLQFDNIIFDEEKEKFLLLDWRQDFGGHVDWGDLYYDLSKLYGGIILNYDYIKLNLLEYKEDKDNISFDFAQRFLSAAFLRILTEFIQSNGWDIWKVRIMVPLIYLNMSPLHQIPFDRMLYSLGRWMLFKELRGTKEKRT